MFDNGQILVSLLRCLGPKRFLSYISKVYKKVHRRVLTPYPTYVKMPHLCEMVARWLGILSSCFLPLCLLFPDKEGYPSGQREQTVNLPALPSKVRILPPPPNAE